MEKLCINCNVVKSTDNFHFRKTEKRYNSWCKACLYTYQHQRWIDRKRKAIELLGGKCNKCGYNKNMAAMHFHHLDPSKKEMLFSRANKHKWEIVVEELKKCILLCANCHAEEHNPNYLLSSSVNKNNRSLNDPMCDNIALFPTGKCPTCNKDTFGTKYCTQKCAAFDKRKVIRPSKLELIDKLQTGSFCSVAREYNISDNAVRKWAKQYKLLG